MVGPRLGFRVLGPVEVRIEGELAPIGSRRQRAILLDLLLHRGEVLSRDRLIDDVWGERPPATVAKALHVHVSQLRRVLERPGTAAAEARVLLTRPAGYLLAASGDDVDAGRFERLLDDGREALAAGCAAAAGVMLREALALWRGPALGDLALDGFAHPEAVRLDELHLEAVEARIEADLAASADGLVGELEGLVRRHPLRERLRGQLIRALYGEGRQHDALAAYRSARRTLVEELGIEPGPALRRVHEAVLRQDAALDRRPTNATEPDGFVGRVEELAGLTDAFARAQAGSGSVCVIGGEPGVGKTRLAERLAAEARERGALVLTGRCWEAGGAPAYWPWVEALRSYARERGLEQLQREPELARIVPELAGAPAAIEDDGARFRLFEAVSRFLSDAARTQPLVIIVDDLQVADTPSLLLLRFLAREVAEARLLIVATYRDTELTPGSNLAEAITAVARSTATRHVMLRGFGRDEMADYVESIAGPTPDSLARVVRAETEGNPLFAGELVRLLVAEGTLEVAAHSTAWDFGVPDQLREVISRRLTGLGDVVREILDVASVLGREFRLDALELVSGRPRHEVADALDAATHARIVASVPGTGERMRFAHALVRDVVYETLPAAERRRLHVAAGDSLERIYEPDIDSHGAELAHHFCRAAALGADPTPAVSHALRAGRHAARLVAFEEAARLYEMALSTLPPSAEVATRCDVVLALGEVLARAGEADRAKGRFRQVAELAARHDLVEHLAHAAMGYGGRFLTTRGTSDPYLVPLLDDALAALGEREDERRVRLLARLAAALRPGSGRAIGDRRAGREEAEECGRRAVEIARRLGDPASLAYAIEGLLLAMWAPGNAPERIVMAQEIVALGDELGDRERSFAGRDHLVPSAWEVGDAATVAKGLVEMQSLADELRQPSQRWMLGCLRTVLAISEGRLDAAERLAAETLELGRGTETWNAPISYHLHLFGLRRAQGRLGEAVPALHSAAREYASYDALGAALGYAYCASGDHDRGHQVLDQFAEDDFAGLPQGEDWLFAMALLGETCTTLGDQARAAVLYAHLAPHAELVSLGVPDGSNDAVSRTVGLLAVTLRREDEAIEHLRRGIVLDDATGARPGVVRGQRALAEILLRRGEDSEAERLLRDAEATCRELRLAL